MILLLLLLLQAWRCLRAPHASANFFSDLICCKQYGG